MDTARKINLAIIGTGHWGPNLVRNFHDDPRVVVKMICDLDKARAMNVAAKYRDVETTNQLEEVLQRPDIDAVAICTPTNTHFDVARRAMEAGKHVFIEKPLATTAAECEALIHLAQKRRRKLMVGHVFLYNPAVQYIKGLIEKQELGDITYIYGVRVNLGPIRKDVNALWDLAPHDIAIFNYWLGSAPIYAHATGLQSINPPIHDVVFATLKYPNNVLASLQVSWLDPRKIRQITVVGTKRMVVFDDLDPVGPVHIYDKTVIRPQSNKTVTDTIQAFKAVVQEGDLVIPKIPAGEPLKNECRHFIDWLIEGKEPVSNGKNGLEVVRVLEAATLSLAHAGIETAIEAPSYIERPMRLEAAA